MIAIVLFLIFSLTYEKSFSNTTTVDEVTLNANKQMRSKFPYSNGQNCSTIRLDEPPEVMSKVPIQDQNGIPICWAYATTQILDAWKIKNDPPLDFISSPYPLALQYKAITGQTNFKNGESPSNLLKRINEFNSCSYKTFNDIKASGKSSVFINDLLNAQKNSKSELELRQKIYECALRAGFNTNFKISELADHLNMNNRLKNINTIVQDMCKAEARKYSDIPKPDTILAKNSADAIEAIKKMRTIVDKRLESKSTPTTIGYCHGILKDRELVTIENAVGINEKKCPTELHTNPIVGRRIAIYTNPKNGKQTPFCQYLLRDSFGTSCAQYPEDTEMTPSDKCIKGQVWVDEDALFLNTDEIVYLKDKDET